MTRFAWLSETGTDPWWLYHSHFLGFITMFSKKNSNNPGLIYIAMVLKILAKTSNNRCLHNCWFFNENCQFQSFFSNDIG
jgi:4-amino-4-deoxy-L-arabinose transferase-like glycosyltransferase